MKRWGIAALLAACTSPAWAAEAVPLVKDIKDWSVLCDNTRQCTALNGNEDSATVRVTREAGPQGTLRLSIYSYLAPSSEPTLDGKPLKAPLSRSKTYAGSDVTETPERWFASGAQALALISELRNGQQLSFTSRQGDVTSTLNGMSASLLLMDSVQGRVGSDTALIQRGATPAAQVPPAPAPVMLRAATKPAPLSKQDATRIGLAVAAATRKDWGAMAEDGEKPVIKTYPLSDGTALVLINTTCGENCAYWIYQAPRTTPEQARPMAIDVPPFSDKEMDTVGNASYQPDTGELNIDLTNGGKGGGSSTTWQYDGKRFQVRRLSQLSRVNGLGEADWPVLWRADVQR